MSARYRHDIVNIAMSTMVNDANEIWQGTDVDTISTRYRQHRDVDHVNDVSEVWQATDDRVPMLTRYRNDIVNIAMPKRPRYRWRHDIDTISSTSRCRRYRKNVVNWTYLARTEGVPTYYYYRRPKSTFIRLWRSGLVQSSIMRLNLSVRW